MAQPGYHPVKSIIILKLVISKRSDVISILTEILPSSYMYSKDSISVFLYWDLLPRMNFINTGRTIALDDCLVFNNLSCNSSALKLRRSEDNLQRKQKSIDRLCHQLRRLAAADLLQNLLPFNIAKRIGMDFCSLEAQRLFECFFGGRAEHFRLEGDILVTVCGPEKSQVINLPVEGRSWERRG